jgi:hypothetical protein
MHVVKERKLKSYTITWSRLLGEPYLHREDASSHTFFPPERLHQHHITSNATSHIVFCASRLKKKCWDHVIIGCLARLHFKLSKGDIHPKIQGVLSATVWPIAPAPDAGRWLVWNSLWNDWQRENRSTRRKPALITLCPPQIPHDLSRVRKRAAAVGSRPLISWAMARRTKNSCVAGGATSA